VNVEDRLARLGLQLPIPPRLPAGTARVACRWLLFISGQLPIINGELKYRVVSAQS